MSKRGRSSSKRRIDRRASRRRVLQGLGLGAVGLAGVGETQAAGAQGVGAGVRTDVSPELGSDPAILVFSATAGYRHEVIPTANETIQELATQIGDEGDTEVTVDVIESDASQFPTEASALSQYDVVVWNSTTGDVLNEDQQAAFEEYIRNGGGYMGVHAAADTEYDWEFYGGLVGAYFEDHPPAPDSDFEQFQEAEVHVTDRTHPSTSHLPAVWTRTDEWYNYQSNPRGDVHVLAALDQSSYNDVGFNGSDMGYDHPIAWAHYYQGARSWYTGGGHLEENYSEEGFRQHLKGGLLWSAGYVDGGASGTVWDHYEKVPLDTDTEAPAMLDVAPDGRVFYIERGPFGGGLEVDASVNVIDQSGPEPETSVALDMTVYGNQEDGLLGIVLDSDFEETGWVYLFYSPTNEEIADTQEELDYLNNAGESDDIYTEVPVSEAPVTPYNQLSRFTFEDGSIDPDSEVEIMRVHTQRDTCCHTGGDMHWGPDGEMLYLTTGDDTNPFQSNGYTPIDEREERTPFDAQRTAANTNDLRGKILRIIPNEDGSYDIPEDNLFAGDSSDETRPEIYTMGNRNPYRAAVDQETGTLYWADYGPDAGSWDAERGPPGIVEFNKATEPGFYGWPYFVGPSIPYVDGQFVDADNEQGYTFEPDGPFDPQNPTNDSPNNDGLSDLPPSQEAMIYYPYSWEALLDSPPEYAQEYLPDEAPWPQLTGGAPMAGPVFRYHDDYDSSVGLPSSFDGKFFIMEWGAGWIKYVSFDDDGNVMEIDPFLPDTEFLHPMDMKTGPDGSLYLVEWGSDAFASTNDDSGIYRINHLDVALPSPQFTDEQVSVAPGESTTVEASLTNSATSALESGEVTLTAPDDSNIEVGGASGTTFDSLAAGESQTMTWDVTVSDSVSTGAYTLTATATYTYDGEAVERTAPLTVDVAEEAAVSVPFGYDAGGDQIDGTVTIDGLEYVDSSPAVTASGDADASGSGAEVAQNSTSDPISGTENDALFQTEQYGGNLSYDVAIENGTYDVTLYFAEFYWGGNGNGGGEGSRVFDVSVEGQQVFSELDIYAQVGHDAALVETVEGVEVSDGTLDITTTTVADNSKFAGFAIRSTDDGGEPTTIELGGETTGWVGEAPSSIEGETNPTLELTAGEEYTVTWENLDGNIHDFHVLNAQGDEIEGTGAPAEGYLTEVGATASVTFTATEEMAEYYCSAHPTRMRGSVSVDGGGGDGLQPVVGDSPPTDPDGDGLYEDVDGDGEVTYADVTALFENFESSAVQNNPEAFDFNDNGRLDFDDVIALFNSL